MARPSVKEQRTEEILQAYERCIALYGVEGATLQKIAEEANIARPLLRHHIGNSDDLLNMAVTRFIGRNQKSMQEELPAGYSGEDFVNSLFQDTSSQTHHNDTMIAAAFINAAQTNPYVQKQMQIWLEQFIHDFSMLFQKLYPSVEPEIIGNVSAGIIGMYFNVESLVPLGANTSLRDQSHKAALYLLETLNQQKV